MATGNRGCWASDGRLIVHYIIVPEDVSSDQNLFTVGCIEFVFKRNDQCACMFMQHHVRQEEKNKIMSPGMFLNEPPVRSQVVCLSLMKTPDPHNFAISPAIGCLCPCAPDARAPLRKKKKPCLSLDENPMRMAGISCDACDHSASSVLT